MLPKFSLINSCNYVSCNLTCHAILCSEPGKRLVSIRHKLDEHTSAGTDGIRNIRSTEFSQKPSSRIVPSKDLNVVVRTSDST